MTLQERIAELQAASEPHLKLVYPPLADAVKNTLIPKMAEAGLYFGAFMGYRDELMQAALYAQSRLDTVRVNKLRALAQLGPITDEENKKKVTDLKFGYHQLGLAVDLVEDGDPDKVGVQWSWSFQKGLDFKRIGDFVKSVPGLKWGGWWNSWKDYPHVEMTYGVTEVEGKAVYMAAGGHLNAEVALQKVWDLVNERKQKGEQ